MDTENVFSIVVLTGGLYRIYDTKDLALADRQFTKAISLWGRPLATGSYRMTVTKKYFNAVTTYKIELMMF